MPLVDAVVVRVGLDRRPQATQHRRQIVDDLIADGQVGEESLVLASVTWRVGRGAALTRRVTAAPQVIMVNASFGTYKYALGGMRLAA